MAPPDADAILGFDTSTEDAAVCVVRGDAVLAETLIEPLDGGRPRHSPALLWEIERLVGEAGGWEAIERIGVGVGPGLFTGLRIGVATARALAQSAGVPVVAVGSLDALGDSLAARPDADGRELAPMIDARRGEVFYSVRAQGSNLLEPALAPPERLAEALAKRPRSPLAGGSGALRFRLELERAGIEVIDPQAAEHRASGAAVCRLAMRAQAGGPESIEPIYLRRPDAELWRERHQVRPEATAARGHRG